MPAVRADLRAWAIVHANLAPHLKKGASLPKFEGSMLDFEPRAPKKPMSGKNVMNYLKRLTRATGGKVITNGNSQHNRD